LTFVCVCVRGEGGCVVCVLVGGCVRVCAYLVYLYS